ncbi:MAG: hypothetical protein JXQ83_08930 [Candidatus Glassbacteria bacterium]|nr:hypothetical protein [Candidatus Glassbacteria bacterium]
MRCLVLSLGLVFLLSAVVPAAAASPVDFTGEWALDLEKSDQGEGFGGRRSMLALKMIVEQKDNALKVEAFRRNRDGEEMSMVSDYTLDGKECRNESGNR